MPSLGEEFRAAREARGLSLSDVAENIHIRTTYLQAIEDEEWSAIGAPVYVRGFLRTYARFLGLDPEASVEAFNNAVPSSPPTKHATAPAVSQLSRGRGVSVWAWLGVAVAVALLGYVGYGYYQLKTGTPVAIASPIGSASPAGGASEEPVAVTSASPAAAPDPSATAASSAAAGTQASPGAGASPGVSGAPAPSTTPAVPASPSRPAVSLKLTGASWLRVSVDGSVVLEGVFPAGTVRDFHGKHVHVIAGNAGGVEVAALGRPSKALGASGEVVERDYALVPKTTRE